ncbi:hypothetical protein [Sphingomonas sp.]|jgi:hypothetical protein|uniref:hypothetical protein n=1 Tax=Sphingomonas sp. TaxID=28214 RepID=UPI002EDB3E06
MRSLVHITPILLLGALAGCTPTAAEQGRIDARDAVAQTKLDAALAGLVPGKPTMCLPLTGRQQYQTEGYGPTILYKVSRGLIYRNDTNGGCAGIARGDILVTRQVTGQACSGDIATTIDNTSRFQTGSCALGQFVPYRQP